VAIWCYCSESRRIDVLLLWVSKRLTNSAARV
jgi:hypothetical protein